jgi:hypothetical protein
MRSALFLLLASCAPEAQIQLVQPPFLLDSYPGNGSVLPADQATPLLLRFSKAVADPSSAHQNLELASLTRSGEASELVALSPCRAEADGLLLECPVAGTLAPDTRYRLTIGTGIAFTTGEVLISVQQRWFQTLP